MTAVFKPVPPTPLEAMFAKRLEAKWQVPKTIPIQPCNCIGPQPGKPVCPCQMAGVQIENGRYIKRIDLGPAPDPLPTIDPDMLPKEN